MVSINIIVKCKQYLWLGIVVVGIVFVIGGVLYLFDVDMFGNGEIVVEQEFVLDMIGVVDMIFDDKVCQYVIIEMQVMVVQMQKQYEEICCELDVLNKQCGDDQCCIEKLGQDNVVLVEQVKVLGVNFVMVIGEFVLQMFVLLFGLEGELQSGNIFVFFLLQGSVVVLLLMVFYFGNGVMLLLQVMYQFVLVFNWIQCKVFICNE